MSVLFKVLFALGQALVRSGESVCRFATMQYAKRSVVPTVTVGADPWFDLSAPAAEASPPKCDNCWANVPVNDWSWCDECATASPWETEHCLQCDRIVFNDGSHKCQQIDTDFVCASCNKSLKFDGAVRAQTNFQVYCEPCYDREHDWKVYLNDDFA